MKVYTVFLKPQSNQKTNHPIFVVEGFSVTAAIFNIFWSLYHNSWLSAAIILIINIMSAYLLSSGYIDQQNMPLIHIAISLTFGLIATDLLQLELNWRGYKIIDIIYAGSQEEAHYKYFGNQLKSLQL